MKKNPRWLRILVVLAALLAIALIRANAPDPPAQVDDGQLHWGNPSTLEDHFQRHGADFRAESPEDYARQAHALYLRRDFYQHKTDAGGTVRVYNGLDNAFGAYNADGATKTYFKPSDGRAYYDRQPGE